VQAEEVTLLQRLIKADEAHTLRACLLLAGVWVVGQHHHAQATRTARHLATNLHDKMRASMRHVSMVATVKKGGTTIRHVLEEV
jgi:hypothetical protein